MFARSSWNGGGRQGYFTAQVISQSGNANRQVGHFQEGHSLIIGAEIRSGVRFLCFYQNKLIPFPMAFESGWVSLKRIVGPWLPFPTWPVSAPAINANQWLSNGVRDLFYKSYNRRKGLNVRRGRRRKMVLFATRMSFPRWDDGTWQRETHKHLDFGVLPASQHGAKPNWSKRTNQPS